jgi:hypothetical protein
LTFRRMGSGRPQIFVSGSWGTTLEEMFLLYWEDSNTRSAAEIAGGLLRGSSGMRGSGSISGSCFKMGFFKMNYKARS